MELESVLAQTKAEHVLVTLNDKGGVVEFFIGDEDSIERLYEGLNDLGVKTCRGDAVTVYSEEPE